MVDYIVIGAGLAGIAFCERARSAQKSVVVYDDDSHHASSVAAGVVNPVVLKRYSGLDGAPEQLEAMQRFYADLKSRYALDCFVPMPVLRRFASIEEQNQWFVAADRPKLAPFLSAELIPNQSPQIDAPFGFGRVLNTGYVRTDELLSGYRRMLSENGCLREEKFDWSRLELHTEWVEYDNMRARHIICAEGFGIKQNPYFRYLPLEGTKGEVLHIRARDFSADVIYKAGVFLLPTGNGEFKVGATYAWDDKTEVPTEAAKQELIAKLREFFKPDFEIIGQSAAIRPTVKDRKPLVGTHPENARLHILNGLGTRGVMLGPLMAEVLFDHIEYHTPVNSAISIDRFQSLYELHPGHNPQKS